MSAFEKNWEYVNGEQAGTDGCYYGESCNNSYDKEQEESDCEICDYVSDAWEDIQNWWDD